MLLDRDLAKLYETETKILNQAVKRNIERFPEDFMFQLSKEEFLSWRSHFVTSKNDIQGLRRAPYAFTEQGVSMLSSVLRSSVAIEVSVKIIRAFVAMRKFISLNANVFDRLSNLEKNQIDLYNKQNNSDNQINDILNAIEEKDIKPKQGIFYDGQIFDAYHFPSGLIKSAKKNILIIDNYIDDSVLHLLSKREQEVTVTIYTSHISKILRQDLEKYNSQYPKIKIKLFKKAHDRFLIIDKKDLYHFGASLKDLGKKWFAFSKIDIPLLKLPELH